MSLCYIHANLVIICQLVHEITCKQESVMPTLMPTPTGFAPKTICPPHDKVNKVEKWQKLTTGLNPNHMHIFKPWKKDVQSCIKIGTKLYKKLCLQGTHSLYTFIKVEKVTKIYSRIISKPHAHLQTMKKTCAKFQKDWYKIVWRVALTR